MLDCIADIHVHVRELCEVKKNTEDTAQGHDKFTIFLMTWQIKYGSQHAQTLGGVVTSVLEM